MKMKDLDTRAANAGSGPNSTFEEQRAFVKWEKAADVAFDAARAVILAPATTLEGILMKLHVSGFAITDTAPGTFAGPYRPGVPLWQPGKFAQADDVAIIVSLRNDLLVGGVV